MIGLNKVSKTFKKKDAVFVALDSLDLELPSKSLVVLSGKSGAGKTTLLNILGGLDFPTQGEMHFNDVIITMKNADDFRENNIGYVFQDYNLLNHVSVAENLKVAFDLNGEKATMEKMTSALSLVGLPDKGEDSRSFLKKRPVELSGGQRQRVAIARALIKNPNILLLDEPTGALDEDNSLSLLRLLKNLSKDRLVVLSTHNLAMAKPFADRLIKLDEGKIVSDEAKKDFSGDSQGFIQRRRNSHLGFTSVLRSAIRGLKNAKVRLITSLLLSTIVTGFLGVLVSIKTAERNEVALRSQYEGACSRYYDLMCDPSELSIEEKNELNNYCGDKKPVRLSKIDIDIFSFVEWKDDYVSCSDPFYNLLETNDHVAMFLNPETGLHDASLKRDPRLKESTPCRLPVTEGEIAITDFQAQYFLERKLKDHAIVSIDDLIGVELFDKTLEDYGQTPPKYTITGIYQTDESLEVWQKYSKEQAVGVNSKELAMSFGFSPAKLWICPDVESASNPAGSSHGSTVMAKLSGSLQKDLELIHSLSYLDSEGVRQRSPRVENLYSALADRLVVSDGMTGILIYTFTVISIILSLLLSLNLFYANIKGMERELGILRALGAKKDDIRSIVFAQGGFIWLIEFVLAMAAIIGVNSFLNKMIWVSLLYANWIVILSVVLSLFVGMAAVSLFASIKAIRQRPVNVIDDK